MTMTQMSDAPSAPALSVAMSVYNAAPHLAQAIDSILAQTFRDFEFLILNDGSTDDSGAIIDAYAARDPRIRVIHRENRGLITSLNELVDAARAPIIARMDADDIAIPERFAKQMAFLDANPDYGVVGAWTRDIDEAGKEFWLVGGDQPTDHETMLASLRAGGMHLCHPTVMYRKALVQEVGGYHRAFVHCEDYDLWLRMAAHTKMASLPERLLFYRHSAGQISTKHAIAQQTGAGIAYCAYLERDAGRPDPTEHLDHLPALQDLDTLFGRPGVMRTVRDRIVHNTVYSKELMQGPAFDVVVAELKAGASRTTRRQAARTVLRLLRFGLPVRAMRLAGALLLSPRGAA